jgi:hypothetical protein
MPYKKDPHKMSNVPMTARGLSSRSWNMCVSVRHPNTITNKTIVTIEARTASFLDFVIVMGVGRNFNAFDKT